MALTRVTTDTLRKLPIGETIVAVLPDTKAIDTAKTMAYRLQHELRCKFTCTSDYINRVLTIKKTEQTISHG